MIIQFESGEQFDTAERPIVVGWRPSIKGMSDPHVFGYADLWLEESSVLRRAFVQESAHDEKEPVAISVRELLLNYGCWWTRGTTVMQPQPEPLKRMPWAIGHVELIQVLSGEVNAAQPISLLVTSEAQSAARSVDIFLKLRAMRRLQHERRHAEGAASELAAQLPSENPSVGPEGVV